MAVWTGRKGGAPSSTTYVYQTGGGAVTLKTATADASAVTTFKDVDKVASPGALDFGSVSEFRQHRIEFGGSPGGGDVVGGGGSGGGGVDSVDDNSIGVVGHSTSHGGSGRKREHNMGTGGWVVGVRGNPIRTDDDGDAMHAVDTPCLPVCSTTPLQSSPGGHPSMSPLVAGYHSHHESARGDCAMDDPPGNELTGRVVSPLKSAGGRSAHHKLGLGGMRQPVLHSHGTMPPPLPPGGASSRLFQTNDRDRKKLRIPPCPITGMALRPTSNEDTSIAKITESSTTFDCGFRDRYGYHRLAEAADKTPVLSDIASTTTGAHTPADSGSQQVINFPSSVSYAEQTSLRLAFGSALTQESWLSGTSGLVDMGMVFDESSVIFNAEPI